MTRPSVIVVFGAAVWPGGRASPSLMRRIGYAEEAAAAAPHAMIFCSGGVGRHPPSEASIMARVLISRGVDPARLVLDEDSKDTLQSAAAAARFLRSRGERACIAISDAYHLPRIQLVLRALGVRASRGPTRRGHGGAGRRRWLYMQMREAPAIPYDLILALVRRRGLLAGSRAGQEKTARISPGRRGDAR
ncbi:YdcF family protein [Phenylobacterium deserti]|uniref:YdcF family protein n=1 Tax=Phenylobacterium deserti TaxID=1914756 RepID=UPI00140370FF|nr:YdcF family protein [Phenylobacterium deserti]